MGLHFSWTRAKEKDRNERPWCSVVVPAAGNASRMEGTDKILADLAGMPVIAHTLLALQQCPYVDEIVVVTREDLMAPIGQIARQYDCRKVTRVVRGGSTRAASVSIGVGRTDPRAQLIGIHDGARPLVSQAVLEEVFTRAAATGAAAPAVPVKDTIKRVRTGEVVTATVPRSDLRAVQTPQVFDADLIKAALHRAMERELPITDDCSAVERMGMSVKLVEGDEGNLKVTTPLDLKIAELLLEDEA